MTDMSRLSTAVADRYTIERQLGQGGMATVYLAQDVATLERLKALSQDGRVAPFNQALVYIGLGDQQRALDYLEGRADRPRAIGPGSAALRELRRG
jgi:serine/threonine protein kinase